MEALIPVIGKLQDVFATIGYRESEVQLPQIVVIGAQSAGKSSVIEGIVGRDFLPRGTGIVTRRPLLLHLIHVQLNDPQRTHVPGVMNTDWALFEHKPDDVFTDFEAVRREIEEETSRVTGTNKGVSAVPINLKIFSHKVVNLSLIDLPGLTKVPVGDQPPDIEVQVRRMIHAYITNPNSLILAVTPANQDFATSEPMKHAREVDPEGNRTLAVLTKLDLMDAGTDAMDVLTGKLVPVKLGIIGVVNRSQADINSNKSIQACLKDEIRFLQKKYPTLASINGIMYLSKTLNRLLMHHIRECLPQLKLRVSSMMVQCQTLLHTYGEPVTDQSRTLLQIITNFSNAYTSAIDGTSKNIETTELSGGARIHYIFHDIFAKALEKVDPMESLNKLDILTAIQNAMGTRSSLFVPDITFELLVKRQIRRLEEPSLCCVDLVYEELLRIVQHCGFEIEEIQRFPRLFERINEVLSVVLSGRLSPTKEFVSNLVNIQLAYINNKHPEFGDAAVVTLNSLNSCSITELPAASAVSSSPAAEVRSDALNKQGLGGLPWEWAIYDVQRRVLMPAAQLLNGPVAIAAAADAANAGNADGTGGGVNGVGKGGGQGKGGVGGWIPFPFARGDKATAPDGSSSTTTNNGSGGEKKSAGMSVVAMPARGQRELTNKEKNDCQIIERLIRSYYVIVRKTIQDQVPKAVMHFLVNNVRDTLQSELVRQLYNASDLGELLSESDSMAGKRKDASEMLEALKKANSVISEIRETYIW